MSDIPAARRVLQQLLPTLSTEARRQVNRALALMFRVESVRRAPARRRVIDKKLRRHVRIISRKFPDMTMHEIANMVGLRSSGRISDILHGRR